MTWTFPCRAASMALALFVCLLVPATLPAQEKSGTVIIDETQIAFIFSGQIGGGRLDFRGRRYDFKIGGLGVGGFGASQIRAFGDVYNLFNVDDFAGVFGQARTGWAAGFQGSGHLWLENAKGVIMGLKTDREGLMLTLGADGVLIRWD